MQRSSEIASRHGDAACHVGDERAEGGAKKGDTVVEVGAADGAAGRQHRVRGKNERLTKNDAWDELSGRMGERDAAYAVLVVAGDDKRPRQARGADASTRATR